MRKFLFPVIGLFLLFFILGAVGSRVYSQQQSLNPDDFMKGEDFTKILKDEWSYLKDGIDEYLASIEKKTEFETTKEFGERVDRTKAAFVAKINNHILEKKFDKRVFGVLFKASLESYNADQQQYLIRSAESVEAPYDIPSLRCVVPKNSYVVLTDSINRGFRSSALRIKFPPKYRWGVSRDDARAAKNEEPNIYFEVRFVLDLRQEDLVKQAKLRIIPTQFSMLNSATHKIYWSQDIK